MRRSQLLVVVAIAAAVLLVAEVAMRLIAGNLREPLEWHTYQAQVKVHQIDALAERGGADIVFLGTSMMDVGVDPALVQQALGRDVVAYNASLDSSIGRQTELWAKSVVLPKLHPKLLVIGVGSYDFEDNGASRTAFYDAFVAAPAARRALHTDDALDAVDRFLTDHSSLWAHRFQVRDPATVLDAIRGRAPAIEPDAAGITPNGWSNLSSPGKFVARAGLDVSTWAPGTKDPGAIERLVVAAQALGTRVAIVDMPVTDDYVARHPHGEADYQTFVGLARDLAARHGAVFVQLDQIRDHSFFADEVHLNGAGTATFDAQLVAALQDAHAFDGIGG